MAHRTNTECLIVSVLITLMLSVLDLVFFVIGIASGDISELEFAGLLWLGAVLIAHSALWRIKILDRQQSDKATGPITI